MTVEKVEYWRAFNRRSELLVAVLNSDAVAGKLNVPYEATGLHSYKDCWLSCLALVHSLPKEKLIIFLAPSGFWPTKIVKLISCLFLEAI